MKKLASHTTVQLSSSRLPGCLESECADDSRPGIRGGWVGLPARALLWLGRCTRGGAGPIGRRDLQTEPHHFWRPEPSQYGDLNGRVSHCLIQRCLQSEAIHTGDDSSPVSSQSFIHPWRVRNCDARSVHS